MQGKRKFKSSAWNQTPSLCTGTSSSFTKGTGPFSHTADETPYLTANNGNAPYLTANNGNAPYLTANNGNAPYLTANIDNAPYPTANIINHGNGPSFTANNGNGPSFTANNGNAQYLTANNGNAPYPTADIINNGNAPYLTANNQSSLYTSADNVNTSCSTENPMCNTSTDTVLEPDSSVEMPTNSFQIPSNRLHATANSCEQQQTFTTPSSTKQTPSAGAISSNMTAPGWQAKTTPKTRFKRTLPAKDASLFSKPIILATAKQVGSSIQTSCNTDSIRQLQNPYTEYTGSMSSEYFKKKRSTPAVGFSSRVTLTSGSASTGRSRTEESENISSADVGRLATTGSRDGNSSMVNDSQIYMGVLWHGGKLGVAYYDLDTTVVSVMLDIQECEEFKLLLKVIKEMKPAQVIVSSKQDERLLKVLRAYGVEMGYPTNEGVSSWLQFLPSIDFSAEICKRRMLSIDLPSVPDHYTDSERTLYLSSLIPFENLCMVRAAGGLLKYLEKMRIGIELEDMGTRLPVLDVNIITLSSQMILDDTAYSALQIFKREAHPSVYKTATSNGAREGLSLFGILNRTKSQLGSRMLRTWFQRPLKDRMVLESRHASIAYLNNPRNIELVSSLEASVKHMKNISKILVRMRTAQASVGDWQALYKTVYNATCIKEICCIQSQSISIFKKISETFTEDLHKITLFINKIVDLQECSIQGRFVVKEGVDEKLDKKKKIFSNLPEVMYTVANQEALNLADNITECHVIYLPQIGYLLALPETGVLNATSAENSYEIQGLEFVFASNNVLYYRSAGTKELDSLLGDTRCEITDMETGIMHKLQNIILEHTTTLMAILDLAAELDCLLSLAACAREYNYVRPTFTDDNVIEIVAGRHPLQEVCCSMFVPNDVTSDDTYGKVKVLTGPNACGKSVYLKQVALIVFMAQIGSFVPAESAKLGLFERIFTRIRSLESVSIGLSTFMIDINQMAEALRRATKTSLCIVDEFGKGTDMIDGLSLLCASIRHWLELGDSCPHVFVSTHFHSIVQQQLLPRSLHIKYLSLESLHNGEEIVFLYQLVEGHTSSSYACHVATQAGLPSAIVKRGTEASELIRQCKPVQRVDTVGTETQYRRCEAIVGKFLELDLGSADIKAFLSQFVLPVIEGKLDT